MKIIGTMLAVLLMLLLPCPGSTLGQAQAASWSSGGSMHDPRVSPTATLLSDGKVLIAGGSAGENGNSLGLASAELYDPATGSWTLTGSLNVARNLHTATLLPGGKVLVAGGAGRDASAELYDPATGTWTLTGSMTNARVEHTATLLAS